MPKVTGGQAEGPNPEQLFAMVYACESRKDPQRVPRSTEVLIDELYSVFPRGAPANGCAGRKEGARRRREGAYEGLPWAP